MVHYLHQTNFYIYFNGMGYSNRESHVFRIHNRNIFSLVLQRWLGDSPREHFFDRSPRMKILHHHNLKQKFKQIRFSHDNGKSKVRHLLHEIFNVK